MQTKHRKFEFVLQVLAIYREYRKPALVALGMLFVGQILTLSYPLLFGQIMNGIIRSDPIREILQFVAIAFAITTANFAFERLRCLYEIKYLDFKVPRDVRQRTLSKVLSLSPGQNRGQNSGKMQAVIDKGEAALADLAPLFLYELMPLVLRIGATVCALLVLEWSIGLVVLLGIVAHIKLTFHLENKFKKRVRRLRDVENRQQQTYTEILRNLFLIQSSSQEERVQKGYGGQLDRICLYNEGLWSKWIFNASGRTAIQILIEFTVLLMGIYYVSKGWCTPGSLIVVIMWTERAVSNLSHVSFLHRKITKSGSAIEKYFAVMKIEPAVQEIPNPVRMTSFVGRVEFSNVSFCYPNYGDILEESDTPLVSKKGKQEVQNKPALNKVSFVIEAGQKVAFVGHSGAGKSTLVALLLRAYDPDQGQITVDGFDLRTLDLKLYRSTVGVVEQGVALFDATLRENLMYGVSQGMVVTEEKLAEVARASNIDQFRDRLKKGFETRIGENGVFLSGGERQRVGIGRALIREPSILVFDEATSSLDALNEKLIKRAIDTASENRTTILIAHRLSTVRDADKIIVFKKGEVVGEGKHEDLLRNCLEYRELVEHQLM